MNRGEWNLNRMAKLNMRAMGMITKAALKSMDGDGEV